MRVMEIPRFPRTIDIPDVENFLRSRLGQTVVMWPDQAIPLLGYMCYPQDAEERDKLALTLWRWPEGSKEKPPEIPAALGRIQKDWLRVADILHLLCDLVAGRHQARRGGPSVSKAMALTMANAKSWGTQPSTLWKSWSTYKDAAHLIAAATLICADARIRIRNRPTGPVRAECGSDRPVSSCHAHAGLRAGGSAGVRAAGPQHLPPTLEPSRYWTPKHSGAYRLTSTSHRFHCRSETSGRRTSQS
jgi:hypothetical protein